MVETVAEVRKWRVEKSWDEYTELERGEDSWGVVRRLEENWQSVRSLHIKTTTGKPVRLF